MQLELVYENQKKKFMELEKISLRKIIRIAKKKLSDLPESFGLRYTDAEGDMIDIICDDDW
jgi:hypothetical protein